MHFHTKCCTANRLCNACTCVSVLAFDFAMLCLLQGDTALMQAASFGHVDMIKYLLTVGADKAAKNHQVTQKRLSAVRYNSAEKHTLHFALHVMDCAA